MRLHEMFRLDNAAVAEAFQHDTAVVQCQLSASGTQTPAVQGDTVSQTERT